MCISEGDRALGSGAFAHWVNGGITWDRDLQSGTWHGIL